MSRMLWILICIVLMVGLVWWLSKPSNNTTVFIIYLKGSKDVLTFISINLMRKSWKLKTITLLFIVPEHGNILTSSPSKFIIDLGWHKEKAFYIDNEGKIVKEINMDVSGGIHTANGNLLSERMSRTFDSNQEHCY